jgi:P27 family predicted phage terminase small subunit
MAGRRPKPTKLKLLQGTQRSDRVNRQEPDPKSEIPSCPKHIQGESRREWKRITKELGALGLLTKVDRAAIAAYCDAYGRWTEALGKLHEKGLLVKAPSGYPILNPYLSIINSALDQMRKFLTEFGMTPSSRTRINVAQKNEDKDDAARFFA